MPEDKESTSKDTDSGVAKDQATIRGKVTYPWGTVTGAAIVVGERTATSGKMGEYEISALVPGAHSLTAEAPFPGYEAASQKVEVAAGEAKVVDIYLDFKKAIVEGHVYDLEGKPIAGATLSGVLCGKDTQATTTDERGYFKFDKVTPGSRFVRVNASGYMGETRDFTTREDGPTSIEFRLTQTSHKVHGSVTDTSGKPLRVEILLLKMGIVVQKTHSNAETGYYEFPVLPGIYQVLPVAPGYQPRGWHGSISADTKVDFNLAPMPEVPEEARMPGHFRGHP